MRKNNLLYEMTLTRCRRILAIATQNVSFSSKLRERNEHKKNFKKNEVKLTDKGCTSLCKLIILGRNGG